MQKPESVGSCIPFGGAVTSHHLTETPPGVHRQPRSRRRTDPETPPGDRTRTTGTPSADPDRQPWRRRQARQRRPTRNAGRPKKQIFNYQSAGVKPLTAGKKKVLPTGKSSKQKTPPDHRKTPAEDATGRRTKDASKGRQPDHRPEILLYYRKTPPAAQEPRQAMKHHRQQITTGTN